VSENATTSPLPNDEGVGTTKIIRADVVAQAIERVRSRGDSTRRYAAMELPPPLFNDLCDRLLSQKSVRATADWLIGECASRGIDSPARSSVERFSDVLFEEYAIADERRRRTTREQLRGQLKGALGDVQNSVDSGIMLLAQKVEDWLMRVEDEELDVKEFGVVSQILRQIKQSLNDSHLLQATITRLETLNAASEAAIRLRDQKLTEMKHAFEGALKDLQKKTEVARTGKRAITSEDIAEVRKAVFG
jgi:hypothetical protein